MGFLDKAGDLSARIGGAVGSVIDTAGGIAGFGTDDTRDDR